MASSRSWSFDDDDRPSGSVRPLSQADLQAILAHLGDDDPNELLAGTGADRPVVAVRVRATVGRPGGSAQARWRQLRAAEWTAWIRTLPWRVAATLGIGAAGGVLGSLLAPRLSLVLGGLAAVAAGLSGDGQVVQDAHPCRSRWLSSRAVRCSPAAPRRQATASGLGRNRSPHPTAAAASTAMTSPTRAARWLPSTPPPAPIPRMTATRQGRVRVQAAHSTARVRRHCT